MTRTEVEPLRPFRGLRISGSLAIAMLLAGPALAEPRRAVVELFTSQGCSSCPPANENLSAISRRPDVIALSFGVTYWDRLGWKDTFARKDYTARQAVYEAPLGESGPFTPQIVVGGRKSIVGHDLAEIERTIARDLATGRAATVEIGPGSVTVASGRAPAGGADVWAVRYDPAQVAVPVRRGENGGRTLSHTNVVRDLSLIGTWTGATLTVPVPRAESGLKTAILVQGRGGGPILGSASD